MKHKKNLESIINQKNEEVVWNREIDVLRQSTLLLWQDLSTLESHHCLQIRDRVDFFEEVRKFEIKLIKRALLHTGGSQIKTARLLGITASTLNSKIKRYRIPIKTMLNKLALADSL